MSKVMKKKEKQALANYVRAMADLLWMRDWDFDLVFGRPEMPEDVTVVDEGQTWGASVDQTRHRQHAVITLPADFRSNPSYSGGNGKQTVAHELIHMHFARCWDQIRVDLLDLNGVSQDVYNLFVANFERNLEYGVDALAYAFAETMPDIDWKFTDGQRGG